MRVRFRSILQFFIVWFCLGREMSHQLYNGCWHGVTRVRRQHGTKGQLYQCWRYDHRFRRRNGIPEIGSGQYYLFTGNLNVSISTKNPGSMGHWSVCINANRAPASGNGNNRPKSPCDVEKNESLKGKGKKL